MFQVSLQSETFSTRLRGVEINEIQNIQFIIPPQVVKSQENSETQLRKETFDILREIDEIWYHLVEVGDIHRLKTSAILNIDFIMSAVRSSSISYLRSMLELIRGSILDWEIDLMYYMTKLSVNIVSQNTDQLASEILLWLRPFSMALSEQNRLNLKSSKESKYLEMLVKGTFAWSNAYPSSLLIPTSTWLHLPLPMQVSVINCPFNITQATLSSDHQNLIFSNAKSIHFFNLPTKTLLKSVEGRLILLPERL